MQAGDDYIEIVRIGSATVDAGSISSFYYTYHQNGIAGSAVINGGSGIDKIIGGISTDQIYEDEGDDDISGPAKRIDAGSGADLLTFEMEDQLVDSHILQDRVHQNSAINLTFRELSEMTK